MLEQQKHTELLKEQSSAENHNTNNKASGSNQLSYEEKYDDSGIWIRGNEEIGYFATAGTFRITEYYETIKEIKDKLDSRDWGIIMNVIITLIDFITTGKATALYNEFIEQNTQNQQEQEQENLKG